MVFKGTWYIIVASHTDRVNMFLQATPKLAQIVDDGLHGAGILEDDIEANPSTAEEARPGLLCFMAAANVFQDYVC